MMLPLPTENLLNKRLSTPQTTLISFTIDSNKLMIWLLNSKTKDVMPLLFSLPDAENTMKLLLQLNFLNKILMTGKPLECQYPSLKSEIWDHSTNFLLTLISSNNKLFKVSSLLLKVKIILMKEELPLEKLVLMLTITPKLPLYSKTKNPPETILKLLLSPNS